MRKLVHFGVLLLLLHACYRFGPVYWNNANLQWDVKEAAHAWQDLTQAQVVDEVVALAERNQVPISREHVTVSNTGTRVTVHIAYVMRVQFLPGWKYPWTFANTIESWTLNSRLKAP